MTVSLFAVLTDLFGNGQVLLSDLGNAGVAVNTTGSPYLVVTNPTERPDSVATYAFAIRHSATDGGGNATAQAYLLSSYDGVSWFVAAQSTSLTPGQDIYEILPTYALGPYVAVFWKLTGTPNPTAKGKAWLVANENFTAKVSSATVDTVYATPASSTEPATEAWVTALLQALPWKAPVRVATAAALPSYTRAANVLTADANGALTVDGVNVGADDRVLVKDGAAGADNGIFVVTNPGSGGAPWVLTRASDANTSAEVITNIAMSVNEGTTNVGMIFRLITTGVITLNTTALTFSAALKVPAPVADADAVNLQTLRARSNKSPVRALTVVALPAYTRTGNNLQANANGALPSQDGIALVVGNRLLLKNGAAGQDNGIFDITDLGSGGTPWKMTRSSDYDESADVHDGDLIPVQEGNVGGDTVWQQTTNAPIVLNTTVLAYGKSSGVLVNTVELVNTDSPYTATIDDEYILCNTAAGAITVNLPAAAGVRRRPLKVANVGGAGNAVTIDPNGAETINGGATQAVTDHKGIEILVGRTGTNWVTVVGG